MDDLQAFANEFATALVAADALRPVAVNRKSGKSYRAGIGPHEEDVTMNKVLKQLKTAFRHAHGRS